MRQEYQPLASSPENDDGGGIGQFIWNAASPLLSGQAMLDLALPGDPGSDLMDYLGTKGTVGKVAGFVVDSMLSPITLVELAAVPFTGGASLAAIAAQSAARTAARGGVRSAGRHLSARAVKDAATLLPARGTAARTLTGGRMSAVDTAARLTQLDDMTFGALKAGKMLVDSPIPANVRAQGSAASMGYVSARNLAVDATATGVVSQLDEDMSTGWKVGLGLVGGLAAFKATDTLSNMVVARQLPFTKPMSGPIQTFSATEMINDFLIPENLGLPFRQSFDSGAAGKVNRLRLFSSDTNLNGKLITGTTASPATKDSLITPSVGIQTDRNAIDKAWSSGVGRGSVDGNTVATLEQHGLNASWQPRVGILRSSDEYAEWLTFRQMAESNTESMGYRRFTGEPSSVEADNYYQGIAESVFMEISGRSPSYRFGVTVATPMGGKKGLQQYAETDFGQGALETSIEPLIATLARGTSRERGFRLSAKQLIKDVISPHGSVLSKTKQAMGNTSDLVKLSIEREFALLDDLLGAMRRKRLPTDQAILPDPDDITGSITDSKASGPWIFVAGKGSTRREISVDEFLRNPEKFRESLDIEDPALFDKALSSVERLGILTGDISTNRRAVGLEGFDVDGTVSTHSVPQIIEPVQGTNIDQFGSDGSRFARSVDEHILIPVKVEIEPVSGRPTTAYQFVDDLVRGKSVTQVKPVVAYKEFAGLNMRAIADAHIVNEARRLFGDDQILNDVLSKINTGSEFNLGTIDWESISQEVFKAQGRTVRYIDSIELEHAAIDRSNKRAGIVIDDKPSPPLARGKTKVVYTAKTGEGSFETEFIVDRKALAQAFKNKEWTLPGLPNVVPLADDAFDSAEQYGTFLVANRIKAIDVTGAGQKSAFGWVDSTATPVKGSSKKRTSTDYLEPFRDSEKSVEDFIRGAVNNIPITARLFPAAQIEVKAGANSTTTRVGKYLESSGPVQYSGGVINVDPRMVRRTWEAYLSRAGVKTAKGQKSPTKRELAYADRIIEMGDEMNVRFKSENDMLAFLIAREKAMVVSPIDKFTETIRSSDLGDDGYDDLGTVFKAGSEEIPETLASYHAFIDTQAITEVAKLTSAYDSFVDSMNLKTNKLLDSGDYPATNPRHAARAPDGKTDSTTVFSIDNIEDIHWGRRVNEIQEETFAEMRRVSAGHTKKTDSPLVDGFAANTGATLSRAQIDNIKKNLFPIQRVKGKAESGLAAANQLGIITAAGVDLGGVLQLAPFLVGAGLRGPLIAARATWQGMAAAAGKGVDESVFLADPRTIEASRGGIQWYSKDAPTQDFRVPKTVTEALKGVKFAGAALSKAEDAFIQSMNTVRRDAYLAEFDMRANIAAKSGTVLTDSDRLAIGSAINRLTGVADSTGSGDKERWVLFAAGYFRSQRQLLRSVINDHQSMDAAIMRQYMTNYISTALTVSAVSALLDPDRDVSDVLLPINMQALSAGELRVNPNLGTVRVKAIDVDLLGWLKPIANLSFAAVNTGVGFTTAVAGQNVNNAYEELAAGLSQAIDSKGSPIARVVNDLLFKNARDFDGRSVASPVSMLSRIMPIWMSTGMEELTDSGQFGDLTNEERLNVGLVALVQVGMDVFGARAATVTPYERANMIVMSDRTLNKAGATLTELPDDIRSQFEEKYPSEFKRLEEYREGLSGSGVRTTQQRAFIEMELVKDEMRTTLEEMTEDYFSPNGKIAYSGLRDFYQRVMQERTISARQIGDIRTRARINFASSGKSGDLVESAYFNAFETASIGNQIDYDLLESLHSNIRYDINNDKYTNNANEKNLLLSILDDRAAASTGNAFIDDMVAAQKYISSSGYYELLDAEASRYSRQLSSMTEGDVTNYTGLVRAIGRLDLQIRQSEIGGYRPSRQEVRSFTLLKSIKSKIDRSVKDVRDRNRARSPELDSALTRVGK
jgi:hypothetical protein